MVEEVHYIASDDQVSADIKGEAAILGLNSGVYYGLNEVGARIWHLLEEPRTITQIRDEILDDYEIDPAQCEQDIRALITELIEQNLVIIRR
jgi:hypothetical protein